MRTDAEYDHKTEQEINQFMSAVGESDSMEGIKVPEKLKKESNIVEKLLNFYVTFLGGIRVSRGDNFFVRLMRRPIIQELINQENLIGHKKDNLYYFGALLYAYSKNIFYYKHAFDNIRSGKEKFMLPFKAKFKEVYSNMFIVRMLDENFLATLLQDINQHDIKIYVKTPSLLQRFQDTFGARISSLVNENDTGVIQTVYSPMQKIFAPGYPFVSTLEKYLKPSDIVHIKEHAYFLDFWLYTEFLNHLVDIETPLYDTYDTMVIAGILATIRETLFGFCLYTSFLRKQKDITEHHIQMLALIYFTDIVNVHEEFFDILYAAYQKIYEVFDPFLADWAKFDDNPGYLQFGHDNWIKFYREKEGKNVVSSLSGEDVMWLRGYLKNITYYNRRYLIPQ